MIALDIRTGRIIWQSFVLPDNGNVPGGFAGGAFVNPPRSIAFDLKTGAPRWSFRGAGPRARLLACGRTPPAWCPPWENNFSVWDFAGSGVNEFPARIGRRLGMIAGIGQKSGVGKSCGRRPIHRAQRT